MSLQSLLAATNQSISEQLQNDVTYASQQEAEAAYLTEVAARYAALLAEQQQQNADGTQQQVGMKFTVCLNLYEILLC